MTQLLNTNDRKLLMKVGKLVHSCLKEDNTSLLDVVSENIETADLNCPSTYNYDSKQMHSMYNIDIHICIGVLDMHIFVSLTMLLMDFFLMVYIVFPLCTAEGG